MAVVGELLVLLAGSNAGLSAALLKSEGELKGFSASATSHGNIASTALKGVGIAGAAVATGVAVYLGAASKSAIEFQSAMGQVGVTAHLSGDALDDLGSAIQHASLGTTVSSLAMVQALIPVAGELQLVTGHALTAADAVSVLGAAESLHVATNTGLAESLKGITDLLLTYHLGTAAAGSVASLLFAAHAQLGLSVESLSGGLQRLQPRIVASGIGIGEMLALVREMEPVVGTGSKAMLKLGAILQSFLLPSSKAQEVLADLHVKLRDASGQFIGLGPAVDLLGAALDKIHSPALRAAYLSALFGKNANIAAELIKQGAPGLAANLAALNGQGTAAGAAATLNENLGNKLEIARATIATMTDAIGGALLPALSGVADIILPIITAVGAWATANPQLASQILLVAGAVGALAYGLTNFGTGLGLLLGPLGLVIGIVAAIGLAAAHFGLFGEGAKGMADNVIGAIAGMVPKVLAALAALGQQIVGWIGSQIPIWQAQIGQWAQAFIGWAGPMIPVVLAALGTLTAQVLGWIGNQIPIWRAQLGRWAQAFLAWIGPMIPPVLAALGTLTGQVAGWIGEQLPIWGAQLSKWVGAFVNWIAPMIPIALGALGQWLATMVNWVLDHLPDIAAALFKLADQFVAWVLPLIPPLLVGLAQLALAILSWIIGEIPHVVVALGKLAEAFVDWIVPKIPGLLLELAKLGLALVGWVITQGIPMAVVALVTLGGKFIGWVAESVPGLLLELGKWVLSLITFIGEIPGKIAGGLIAIGASIISNIIKGIGEVAGAIGAWLFGTPMPAPPGIPGATPPPAFHGAGSASYTPTGAHTGAPVPVVGGTPTPGLFAGSTTTTVGGVPVSGMFQHGGIVPGFGAQLVIAHGGETIIPPGAGAAGGINSVRHIHIEVGGRELMEYIDREMFGSASGFSSGFTSNSPVTGA
jgi:TP901 family phage tail tape measure protein